MSGPIMKNLLNRELELGPMQSSEEESPWQNWSLARDEQQVAWLFLNRADTKVNSLSEAVIVELGDILQKLATDTPRGVVLRSSKPKGFCVGADINEFSKLKSTNEIITRLQNAHAVVNQLEALNCPTVAVIHGSCMGGGLELALCCDYRLAMPNAELGFPEIRLGLHPGLGGTARLTHLIDPIEAMTMMLTGKSLSASRARKAGLIDHVIEERHVTRAVSAAVSGEVKRHESGVKANLLTMTPARRLEARQMRAKSAEKANPEHYPAPEALISLWEEFGNDVEIMRQKEILSFAELLSGPTAKNLQRIFFLREAMKRASRECDSEINHVHVVGAGAMGGDIAAWCAFQGLSVSLFDTDIKRLSDAVKKTAAFCSKRHLSDRESQAVLDRLIPDRSNRGVTRADLVIEAVPEKLELKKQVYLDVEKHLKPGAILATNTSSIPLEELADSLQHPERFVGLHFFNPVDKMQLVEVVEPPSASHDTLNKARAFVGNISRLAASVGSAPGFLVNRVLMPYLLEAILLLDEGVNAETIDKIALDFGMPVGPVELADQVGLDICLDVADMLQKRLDIAMPEVPDWFREKVDKGELGRKTQQGFYSWTDGKPKKQNSQERADDDVLDRLLLPMINTCVTCLREKVVADEDLLDGALVFGTGFAPFRGGPIHYARDRGFSEIRKKLDQLKETHGDRFTPDPGWAEYS